MNLNLKPSFFNALLFNRSRIQAGVQKSTLVFSVLALTMLSCDKEEDKYDFNRELQLDNDVPSQRLVSDIPCGTGTVEFDYTVVEADEMAILELENAGSCNIEVELTSVIPGTTTAPRLPEGIRKFTIEKGGVPRVNSFTIPEGLRGKGKLHFKFSCKQSQGTTGCQFFYRFTTARNTKDQAPVTPSIALNVTPNFVVPGATQPAGANKCVTPPGREKAVKIIVNKSETDLLILFDAVNTCSCDHFIISAVLGKGTQKGIVVQAPQNGSAPGRVVVKKNQTVTLIAACDQGSQTNDPCDGEINNYSFSTPSNHK